MSVQGPAGQRGLRGSRGRRPQVPDPLLEMRAPPRPPPHPPGTAGPRAAPLPPRGHQRSVGCAPSTAPSSPPPGRPVRQPRPPPHLLVTGPNQAQRLRELSSPTPLRRERPQAPGGAVPGAGSPARRGWCAVGRGSAPSKSVCLCALKCVRACGDSGCVHFRCQIHPSQGLASPRLLRPETSFSVNVLALPHVPPGPGPGPGLGC